MAEPKKISDKELRGLLNLYSERDNVEQGAWYLRHVNAMTAEGLHAKSAIAGELAARDIEIDRLKELVAASAESFESYKREVERCYEIAQELDTANPGVHGAWKGLPSVRIKRQVAALLLKLALKEEQGTTPGTTP